GSIAKANRLAKAAADPVTRGLLGELLTYNHHRLDGEVGTDWSFVGAVGRVLGKILDCLPLTSEEMSVCTVVTGRTTTPSDLRELWLLCGRGSGKTIL